MSVESFEQVIPSDYKLSQQIKPIQHTNDRLMQSKSTAEYDYTKNRTKSPERLRQQPSRSFDDHNQKYPFIHFMLKLITLIFESF